MIECPYCKSTVDDSCAGKECSNCGKHIYTESFLRDMAYSWIRTLKRKGPYELFIKAIESQNTDEAIKIMRAVMGKEDVVIESAVIYTIINGPEVLRRPLPASERQTAVQVGEQSVRVSLMPCRACGAQISSQAEACPHCGQPTGVHVCPRCSSTNTKTISGISKATSVFLWGPFAANKVVSRFECRHCGHKW